MSARTTHGRDSRSRTIAAARQARKQREKGYREQALKRYPHVCGRCGRDFTGRNLSELTVHHRDHNHDYNPPDGSNWELLCIYCHENEHTRHLEEDARGETGENQIESDPGSSHQPFAGLAALLEKNAKT